MPDLLTGWNPRLDIPSALGQLPLERLKPFRILVTMIDSTPGVANLPSLVPRLRELGVWFAKVDVDVLIDADTLLALIDEGNMLNGFDEAWLLTGVPPVGKPTSLRLTSDQPIGPASEALAKWMQNVGCTAGLGDGDGLNFATFDPRLASLWA